MGWNAYWMRNSPRTLDILQGLGFRYHIDEPSRDEPFIVPLKGGDFVTVPYTFTSMTSCRFRSRAGTRLPTSRRSGTSSTSSTRRARTGGALWSCRCTTHLGHANRVRSLDRFFAYARTKPDVWFARKDEIAAWALEHRAQTPIYERGAPTVTGLPGPERERSTVASDRDGCRYLG